MKKTILIFLCFFSFSACCLSQESDSLKLAKAFTKALSIPEKKEIYLKEALTLKQTINSKQIDELYTYLEARYLFFSGQLDEAESTILKQLKSNPRAKRTARLFNVLGTISTMRQDYKKAISWYEKAIENYEENGDKKGSALVKSNIANIFFGLSDFESAYNYISEANTELKPFNDSVNSVNVMGILSISEAKTGRFEAASYHARKTLKSAERHGNNNGIALAYLAFAEVAVSEKRHEDAILRYKQTDSVASLVHNANLIHLAHVGLLNNYIIVKDYGGAKKTGEMALAELETSPNKTTEYTIRKNLSEAYAGLNEFEKAFAFRRMADSLYKETSSLKNKEYINELLIRHDSQRKESQLKIERKENLVKEAQLKQQAWILFALGLLLLVAILIFVGYRRTQRTKLNQIKTEQDNELMRALIQGEEKERERVSNELHDGLASDLTGIKMILSQSKEKLPDGVLNALSRVHEQTRRISHNLSPLNLEKFGLVSALRNFVQENSTDTTQIQFYSSKDYLDISPVEHAALIYRITQELIQNALKHSESSLIDVQLMVQEHQLTINIEDNGCGFDLASKKTSFGLMNVKKQVELLDGELSIDSRLEKGTVVFISLPLT